MKQMLSVLFALCLLSPSAFSQNTKTVDADLRRRLGEAELSMLFEGKSPADAVHWQKQFSARLNERLGPTAPPERWETVVEAREKLADHTRLRLTLKAEGVPGLPLYLLIPGGSAENPRAAVVAVHGHGDYGHHAVAGRRDIPGVAEAIEGANYDYGLQFVRRGYVVACPCLIPFGDRVDRDKYKSDPCAVTFVRMMALGRVPIAENVRDVRWAVSFLQRRPEVDGERIGCAGLSYGGRMTMMATALEPRIKVAAVSGALNLLQERCLLPYSCGMQIIPGLLKVGDFSEIGSLIAPRPCVWEMGSTDRLIVKDGWDEKFKARLEKIYAAYGDRDQLHYDNFKGGHRWNGHVAFPLFDKVLRGAKRKLSATTSTTQGDGTGRPQRGYQHPGVQALLPVFRDRVAGRLSFPCAWQEWSRRHGNDFNRWRRVTRERVLGRFLAAPPAVPFDPKIIDRRERNSYTAHKISFNLTGDSRVLAYLLVPDGAGPHPAVLLLHDHGAEFRIGKEKSVEPWNVPPEKAALARGWAEKVYGGRFVGDRLAARGYVVLVYDALDWSDRGGAGYEGQQALASNLLHLGMSFAGLIAHEDLRGAEFLASRPEVDKRRIAAMGHSMGCFRTWQVAAMSDHIAAGVGCCWMATVKGLMVPGNNQTKGQSAFTMTHPGLFNDLDYPDVASLACPKPMLFFAGEQDTLFPVPSVKKAFDKMHRVWDSRDAGDKLVTRILPVPHLFNATMQDEAFDWLDRQLQPSAASPQDPEEGER